MLKIVVCEDMEEFKKTFISIIKEVIIKFNIDYEIISFYEYDNKLEEIIKSNEIKIYILDIVFPGMEGTQIASMIRNYDIKSFIIFITSYFDDNMNKLINNRFMFLKYINKNSDYKKELIENLSYALKNIYKNNIIVLNYNNIKCRIATEDILYIYFIKVERKICIVTTYNNFKFNMSLIEIFNMLNDNFMYSYKSCIVNIQQISYIDKKNKLIIFKNKANINMLSKKYMKEILDYLSKKTS